jgi:hypothetical protein
MGHPQTPSNSTRKINPKATEASTSRGVRFLGNSTASRKKKKTKPKKENN